MSMSTSIIYGFGFEVEKITDDKLIDFIKNHKDTFCKTEEEKELFEGMQKLVDYEGWGDDITCDYFDGYCCDTSGAQGRGSVISNIIYRETGIRMEYHSEDSNCGTEPSVLFAECQPWHLNEKEKALTEENLADICKKYMDELGIAGDPEYLSLEYFG